jgi:hypothetical protein
MSPSHRENRVNGSVGFIPALKVGQDELLSLAERYGVKTDIADLLAYLETEGEERADRLPMWSEFRDLADEYGVAV